MDEIDSGGANESQGAQTGEGRAQEAQSDPGAGSAPRAEAQPPPPRRLTRRREGKVIAGVASGLGAYTGIDPVAFRIGFVVLALLSGVGLVVYLAAILIMPMADDEAPVAPPADPARTTRWLGIGALVLGVAVLSHELWPWRSGLVLGLLLVGLGIALWSRPAGGSGLGPARAGPARPPTPPEDYGLEASGGASQATAASPPLASPQASGPPPRAPSMLGRVVLGAAALAGGGGILLDNLGVLRVSAAAMLAVILLVIGAGLVLGAWWGRARWLIVPGLVLTLVLAVSSVAPASFGDGVGERSWYPTSVSEVEDNYVLGAGRLLVDLSEVTSPERLGRVEARVGLGELVVVAPSQVPLTVRGDVGAGEMDLLGERDGGTDLSGEVHSSEGAAQGGPLVLDVEVGLGELTVRRGVVGDEPGEHDHEDGGWHPRRDEWDPRERRTSR